MIKHFHDRNALKFVFCLFKRFHIKLAIFSGADKSQDSVKAAEGEDSSATNKENTSEQSRDENGKVKVCFPCVLSFTYQ